MRKVEELEGRDLHGKVRTTDPLWLACGVKQLLMRVSRAQPRALPDTPLKKERRQRQVLPPATQPRVSQQPRTATAGSQAWTGPLSLAFPHTEYTSASDEPFPSPNRKWDFRICVRTPLLTIPLSWCTKPWQRTEGQGEAQGAQAGQACDALPPSPQQSCRPAGWHFMTGRTQLL